MNFFAITANILLFKLIQFNNQKFIFASCLIKIGALCRPEEW